MYVHVHMNILFSEITDSFIIYVSINSYKFAGLQKRRRNFPCVGFLQSLFKQNLNDTAVQWYPIGFYFFFYGQISHELEHQEIGAYRTICHIELMTYGPWRRLDKIILLKFASRFKILAAWHTFLYITYVKIKSCNLQILKPAHCKHCKEQNSVRAYYCIFVYRKY